MKKYAMLIKDKNSILFKIIEIIKKSLFLKLGLIFIVLPTFISFIYYGLIASDMYISETKFAVKSSAASDGLNLPTQNSIFALPNSSSQEAKIVKEFLETIDAFTSIDKRLNLISHYSDSSHDIFSRLSKNPTLSEKIKFWHKVMSVQFDQDSNIVTFTVRAYDKKMAQKITTAALLESENLINSMNLRANADTKSLAQHELEIAQNRLDKAQSNLKQFRNTYKDINLKTTAESVQSLILTLETQATQIKAQLLELKMYMKESSPQIQSLKTKLSALEEQITLEKNKLTSLSGGDESFNNLVSEYDTLMTEYDFAHKQLVYAMTSLEQAKIKILSQNLYIVDIAKPSLPDESLYPNTFLFSFYVLISAFMLYTILSFIFSAIREHVGF